MDKDDELNKEGIERIGDYYRDQLPQTFYDSLDESLDESVFNPEYTEDELAKLAGAETIFEYWDRRSDEPEKRYLVFKYFLSLSPRSIRILAHKITSDPKCPIRWDIKAASARVKLQHWAKQHDWAARASAYDRHLMDIENEKYALRRNAAIGDHIQTSDSVLDFLKEQFDQWKRELAESKELGMDIEKVLKIMKEYIVLQRLIYNFDANTDRQEKAVKKEIREIGKRSLEDSETEAEVFDQIHEGGTGLSDSDGSSDAVESSVDSSEPPSDS